MRGGFWGEMIPFKKAIMSTVGQKYIGALTGLGLIGFTVVHLLGNLTLYKSDGAAFNTYAHTLDSAGLLLTLAEIGLLGLVTLHVATVIYLKRINVAARPVKYRKWQSKGVRAGEARFSTASSRNMMWSGLFLLGFLALHIYQFRFGPSKAEGYVYDLHGEPIRDLYRLVHETFQNTWMMGIYLLAMVLLGLHLRHGAWSAFQSLGILNRRNHGTAVSAAMVTAVVLSIGFFLIPLFMHFGWVGPQIGGNPL